jgi:hypothetical protein
VRKNRIFLVHIETLSGFPAFKDQVPFYSKSPVLWTFVGKIDLHICVPAPFRGTDGIKGAKTGTIYKAFGSL